MRRRYPVQPRRCGTGNGSSTGSARSACPRTSAFTPSRASDLRRYPFGDVKAVRGGAESPVHELIVSYGAVCFSEVPKEKCGELLAAGYRLAAEGTVDLSAFLSLAGWRYSMICSVYPGLPMSLAGAGTLLSLDKQKLETGKAMSRLSQNPRRNKPRLSPLSHLCHTPCRGPCRQAGTLEYKAFSCFLFPRCDNVTRIYYRAYFDKDCIHPYTYTYTYIPLQEFVVTSFLVSKVVRRWSGWAVCGFGMS